MSAGDVLKTLALCLVLMYLYAGCGGSHIEPALQPYVDTFVQDGQAQGRWLDVSRTVVQFADASAFDDPNAVGNCNMGTSVVRILQSYWETATEPARNCIMHHELGHCVLGRVHRLDHDPHGAPVSIMYPDMLLDSEYVSIHDALIVELFQ